MIDHILYPHRNFFRAYIDDIVIFIKSPHLKDHKDLDEVFQTLKNVNICLSLNKSFLGYLTVQLLEQLVDTLDLATAEDKLAAIPLSSWSFLRLFNS